MARAPTGVRSVWICDPQDDRCVRHVESPFMPGISVRHSPSCDGAMCALFACDGGNWRLTGQGTLDRAEWIKGWIITQLFTRGLVECNEHPLGVRAGGWWADSYRGETGIRAAGGQRFRSGSKLWALAFAHGGASNDVLLRAMEYAREAISPLKRWGFANSIAVDAVWIARGARAPGSVMQLMIRVSGPGYATSFVAEGQQMPDAEWLWKEYRKPQANKTIGRHHVNVALPAS